jgi:hypothetical protein
MIYNNPFNEDRFPTQEEALNEYAYNAGMDNPEQCWLLNDRDVWVRNPHYTGPDQPHPEFEDYNSHDTNALLPTKPQGFIKNSADAERLLQECIEKDLQHVIAEREIAVRKASEALQELKDKHRNVCKLLNDNKIKLSNVDARQCSDKELSELYNQAFGDAQPTWPPAPGGWDRDDMGG